MNEEIVFKWAKFIAPVLKVLGWVTLLVVIIVHYGDRLTSVEANQKATQDFISKQQAVIQQMQIDEMRTSTILSQVENNLARDENKIDQLEQKH